MSECLGDCTQSAVCEGRVLRSCCEWLGRVFRVVIQVLFKPRSTYRKPHLSFMCIRVSTIENKLSASRQRSSAGGWICSESPGYEFSRAFFSRARTWVLGPHGCKCVPVSVACSRAVFSRAPLSSLSGLHRSSFARPAVRFPVLPRRSSKCLELLV